MDIGTSDVGSIAAYVRQHREQLDSRVQPPFIFLGEGSTELRQRVVDRIGEFSCLTGGYGPRSTVDIRHAKLVVIAEDNGDLLVIKAR